MSKNRPRHLDSGVLNLLSVLLFIVCCSAGKAQNVSHYNLSITIEPESKSITGINEIYFKDVSKQTILDFELDSNFNIGSISYKNNDRWKELNFTRTGRVVVLQTPRQGYSTDQVAVRIKYQGKPAIASNPPWYGGFSWKTSKDSNDWIGVSCQVQGASSWWPCKSDWNFEPDSMHLNFTVPKKLQCISNGTLHNKTTNENDVTWHYVVSNPINPYGVTVNIGAYDVKQSMYRSRFGQEFPVQLWYLPENKEKALTFFPQIKQHLEFLEERLGVYPCYNEKYAVVEAPYSGMEHQTVISIDTFYRDNYVGFNWLHFHELAHEWWGNLITAPMQDFWIHEGFATYMEALYVEDIKGIKHYARFIESYYDRLLNLQPIAYRNKKQIEDVYFIQNREQLINRDYSLKGAYFLHLLRLRMGDDVFFKWMREIINPQHLSHNDKFRQVNTEHLLSLANRLSGKPLDSLFEDILYASVLPDQYAFSEMETIVKLGSKKERIEYMTGQMILAGFHGTSINYGDRLSKDIRNGRVGGILLYERNISPDSSSVRLSRLVRDFQSLAPIPLFISIDEEGGRVNRLKPKYGFPHTVSATYLGRVNNIDSTLYYAERTAKTLEQLGINVNFAPVADLCSNPNNPVIARVERCYSSNPNEVFKHNSIVVSTFQNHGILPVIKHFPGHGSSTRDSHLGIVDVTSSWNSSELIPYKKLINQSQCPALMTAHIINSNLDSSMVPATLSYKINKTLLRDQLGFKGVIFSDDLQMKAISSHYTLAEILTLAVNSGVDVLMFSHNIEGATDHAIEDIHSTLVHLVLDDKIKYERIEESFNRIIELKSTLN
jgi:beta-N-acetylhexosaminidase